MADKELSTWKAGRSSEVIRSAFNSKQVEVLIRWHEDWLKSFVLWVYLSAEKESSSLISRFLGSNNE